MDGAHPTRLRLTIFGSQAVDTFYKYGPSYSDGYESPYGRSHRSLFEDDNDWFCDKFIPYVGRVFEGTQHGGGAGGGAKVAFGPLKGSVAAYDIQVKRLGPDGWKDFREQKTGASLTAVGYSLKIDIKDGRFGGGFSYNKISTTDALRFTIGGTIPNPYSGAAVNLELNVNLGEAFIF